MIHAGELIKHKLIEKGKTVTWFAEKMCCTRTHVYKIFRKKNIDIELLWRASCILECNLFSLYSERFDEGTFKIDVSTLNTVSNMDTMNEDIL